MNKKDITAIKLNSDAFTKKWWQERRPLIVNGCGVGKALETWQRNCPKNPEKILKGPDQESARKASWDLIQAMLKVKKKATRLAKDTQKAADTYIKIAEDYREKIGLDAISTSQDNAEDARLSKALDAAVKSALSAFGDIRKAVPPAIKQAETVTETYNLIASRVKTAKQMSTPPDLGKYERAKAAADKQAAAVDKILTRTLFSNFGAATDPVAKVERQLKGSSQNKVLLAYRAEYEKIVRVDEPLRDAVGEMMLAKQAVEKEITGVDKEAETLRERIKSLRTIHNESFGSVKNLQQSMNEIDERAAAIVNAKVGQDDRAVRQEMNAQAKKVHNEVMALGQQLDQLTQGAKAMGGLAKRFSADKSLVAEAKSMAQDIIALRKTETLVKAKVAEAVKTVAALA